MKVKIKVVQVYVDEEMNNQILLESKKADLRPSVYVRLILNKHFKNLQEVQQ